MNGMYKVVYRENNRKVALERTVFQSAVLEECLALVNNHLGSHVPQFRAIARRYVILDSMDREISMELATAA